MLKFKNHLYREAETRGETFPEAWAMVHDQGLLLFCNVSIAWAGADPAVAKRRIDDAVKAVRNIYNVNMSNDFRGELNPMGVEINSTDHQGVVQINMPLYWQSGGDVGFGEQDLWRELLEEHNITQVSPDDFAAWR